MGNDYGCDRCGQQRDSHEGRYLLCPTGETPSYAMWRQQHAWHDTGHLLTAKLHHGHVEPVLIHPARCTAAFCLCVGEEYRERDPDPECTNCGGTGDDPAVPCWLQHYIDEGDTPDWWDACTWASAVDLSRPVPILIAGDWQDFAWRPVAAGEGEGDA